ncbi:nudix hydrolase 26, chloroplastic-like isoform X1 [Iris pallida]|uniref:Nudix hydrolase 26, chloroplastic-like isoform X1 n=1 Tax=Iris pallida TaxID=29817 RepID=A0AAX6GUE7_IRIPA|nr:nudix hydrolase 26, chloroplastic-like isoform X1 [Iris pallida]
MVKRSSHVYMYTWACTHVHMYTCPGFKPRGDGQKKFTIKSPTILLQRLRLPVPTLLEDLNRS